MVDRFYLRCMEGHKKKKKKERGRKKREIAPDNDELMGGALCV